MKMILCNIVHLIQDSVLGGDRDEDVFWAALQPKANAGQFDWITFFLNWMQQRQCSQKPMQVSNNLSFMSNSKHLL